MTADDPSKLVGSADPAAVYLGPAWPKLGPCPECGESVRISHPTDVMAYAYCSNASCDYKAKLHPTGRNYRRGDMYWIEAGPPVSVFRKG